MAKYSLFKEFYSHDPNTGGGYGRAGASNGVGDSYKSRGAYPYGHLEDYEEDEHECGCDDECDCNDHDDQSDDVTAGILTKTGRMSYADPYGTYRGRVDRSSFAHSSTRGLGENIGVSNNNISPIPNLYKNKSTSTGGIAPTVYKTRPGSKGGFGSKKGWAKPLVPFDELEDEEEDKELYTMLDIFKDNIDDGLVGAVIESLLKHISE